MGSLKGLEQVTTKVVDLLAADERNLIEIRRDLEDDFVASFFFQI